VKAEGNSCVLQFRYGQTNLGYLIHDGSRAIAVDGGDAGGILKALKELNLKLILITNTHSHADHTPGNALLLKNTDAELIPSADLKDGQRLDFLKEPVTVLKTPGHTADSVCFHMNGSILTGDTLFGGKVGRCFTGDTAALYRSVGRIMELPPGTLMYAGHDYVEEYLDFAASVEPDNPAVEEYLKRYDPKLVRSTLEEERKVDPFLRLDRSAVIDYLKRKGLPAETEFQRFESLLRIM